MNTRGLLTCSIALAIGAVMTDVAVAQQGNPPPLPEVAKAVRHDISPPLRAMPTIRPRPSMNRAITTRFPGDLVRRHRPSPAIQDPLRQTSGAPTGASLTPSPTSFPGLSDADNVAKVGFAVVPPDTQGDVGPNHYVQMINLVFAIYDKSGAIVNGGGPFANNTLWSGFGGACQRENDGDPIVLYDHLADRWVFSQFALRRHGYQCFAISTTGDPTGPYYRYQFKVTERGINDYPKLGVWPDGYYYTANEFSNGGQFRGAIAVAFERDKMLNGQPAQGVKFGPLPCILECYYSLQPSHLEGPQLPPAGARNTFVMAWDDQTWGFGGSPDGYRLWDFFANWAAPLSSTFYLPRPGQYGWF